MNEENFIKILICDDEIDLRDRAIRMLKIRLKAQIAAVDNGLDAVEQIRAVPYDLILLDLGMEGLDGWQVIKKVREFNSNVKFIIVTGYKADEFTVEKKEIIKKEVVGVIEKPCNPLDIVRKIVEIFGDKVSITGVNEERELLKGRPEARETVHVLRNLLADISMPCYDHLTAYKHGVYKDRSQESLIAELHVILNNVIDTVIVAKKVVDEIPKI